MGKQQKMSALQSFKSSHEAKAILPPTDTEKKNPSLVNGVRPLPLQTSNLGIELYIWFEKLLGELFYVTLGVCLDWRSERVRLRREGKGW